MAADDSFQEAERLSGTVLRDVSAFLKARGLEYFGGFTRIPIPTLSGEEGRYFQVEDNFVGFLTLPLTQLTAMAGSFYASPGNPTMQHNRRSSSKDNKT